MISNIVEKEKLLSESEAFLKEYFSIKYIDEINNFDFNSKFENLQLNLLTCNNLDELILIFNSFDYSEFRLLCNENEFEKKLSHNIVLKSDEQILILSFANLDLGKISFVFLLIQQSLQRFSLNSKTSDEINNWENIFSRIETPVAIIEKDDFVYHNILFVELNLSFKRCFELQHSDQLELDSEIFKVVKKQIHIYSNEYTLIYLYPIERDAVSFNNTSEELGIISSSLAHELNNPLAGILAGITVLELDVLNNDMSLRLREMESGVKRCKKLVETFLGFSKADPIRSNESFKGQKESFDQAVELMRFRMIENNLKFEINYRKLENIAVSLNSSILTMLFYLLLGEIVTAFSHFSLIAESRLKTIKLVIVERENSVNISWEESFDIKQEVLDSKLIRHLAESQNAKFKFLDGLSLEF